MAAVDGRESFVDSAVSASSAPFDEPPHAPSNNSAVLPEADRASIARHTRPRHWK